MDLVLPALHGHAYCLCHASVTNITIFSVLRLTCLKLVVLDFGSDKKLNVRT